MLDVQGMPLDSAQSGSQMVKFALYEGRFNDLTMSSLLVPLVNVMNSL